MQVALLSSNIYSKVIRLASADVAISATWDSTSDSVSNVGLQSYVLRLKAHLPNFYLKNFTSVVRRVKLSIFFTNVVFSLESTNVFLCLHFMLYSIFCDILNLVYT